MAKILITGGAGFVGYHLAKLLASEKENEVVLVDNLFRGRKDADLEALLARPNVKLVEADLTDRASWGKLTRGFDQVYHLLSINSFKLFTEIPHEVLRVGITSTLHALDWFRSENGKPDAKILYVSSNEVYTGGLLAYKTLPIPTPENVPSVIPDMYDPRWSYAGQKLLGELLFIHYAKAHGLRMTIVRPQNIYGPRAGYDSMIPKIIERIQKRVDPFPLFDPSENRSSCFINDVVYAMKRVVESRETDGKTYNIGAPYETTVREIIEKMFDLAGWRPKDFDIKESPGSASSHSLPDVSRLMKDTGWKADTSLQSGLRQTMEWYAKNPKPENK
jgi:UDP-glucose 4-epimerase